ncbi:ribosome silencing factor [Aristophania vespae]|uniref:Ribosomal silencing factor RsfS n=1 Tax=Aristophania vespae TaxID=2697033 RepID=A0A6P1NHF7_9PROT|nr:ribosome silencing factor [Aristophania vespae]
MPITTGVKKITDVIQNDKASSDEAFAQALESKLELILASLDEDKAENVVVLDINKRASFADKMVIASGLSPRQITSMATHLERRLKESGLGSMHIEGENGSDWVLMDAGDIVVHFFMPESRGLYALERMWGDDFEQADSEQVIGSSL